MSAAETPIQFIFRGIVDGMLNAGHPAVVTHDQQLGFNIKYNRPENIDPEKSYAVLKCNDDCIVPEYVSKEFFREMEKFIRGWSVFSKQWSIPGYDIPDGPEIDSVATKNMKQRK